MANKTIIKIKSKVENPDYGYTTNNIPTSKIIEFECIGKKLPDFFKEGDYFVKEFGLLGIEKFEGNKQKVSTLDNYLWYGEIINPDLRDYIIENHKNTPDCIIKITEHVNYTHINYYNSEKYIIEYENPEIECDECNNKICLKDIQNECNDDYGCINICPKCNAVDSFNYEYEK